MGYRDHYAAAEHVVVGAYEPAEANRLLDPDVPLAGPVVLIIADHGNQERFVIEGTADDFVALAGALRRQVEQ